LSLYSTIFVAFWRIRERKLAVRWGTIGCENVAVGRLRPEYVANLEKRGSGPGSDVVGTVQKGDDSKRDWKVAASVPVIGLCGVGLGVLLMGVFLLEAFVSEVYEGVGQEIVVSRPDLVIAFMADPASP
jgi:anoctamin-10